MTAGTVNDRYRRDIDGLRAVAVLPVVLYHMGLGFPGGFVGVDIFYVISGYLITAILQREIDDKMFSFAGFYERRVRRLFPAMFAMLIAVLAAGWFLLLPSDFLIAFRSVIATVVFSSNVYFWSKGGYFGADSSLNPLLHTWSLAVEEQFYLLFPVFLLLVHRFIPLQLRLLCWLVAIGSLGASVALMPRMPSAVFYLSPFRAWELLAGCLLALNAFRPIASRWFRETVAASGLVLIGYAVFIYSDKTPFPGVAALAPVLGAAALLHCGASGDSLVSRLLRLRPLVYVGAISYSLYLWHWPIIVFTRLGTALDPPSSMVWWMFGVSLLLASISYHFVEQPFRKRKIARSRKSLFAGAAISMGAVAMICIAGVLAHGLPKRFDPSITWLDKQRNTQIPFRQCDGRPTSRSNALCVIGQVGVQPTILIWGDSHALVWAPAFDVIFKAHKLSAYFAPMSGCPPLFGVYRKDVELCHARNVAIRHFFDQQHGLERVIIMARWHLYFGSNSPIVLTSEDGVEGTTLVALDALDATLHYFNSRNVVPVLVGDVPEAEYEVPLVLALSTMAHIDMKTLSFGMHQHDNALFYEVTSKLAASRRAIFVDSAPWFCDQDICRYAENGIPLYFDKDHLSIAGVTSRIPQLAAALEKAGIVNGQDVSRLDTIGKGGQQ